MGRNVMIVDDSATARMLIQRCLEIAGMQDTEYHQASDGNEALKTLAGTKMDLVLTDLNMPNLNGEQLVRAIRADGNYKDIPVIMITSTSNEARKQQLRDAGANIVLPKPVSPQSIDEAIHVLFGDIDG